jgi:VanZ family protein
MWSENESRPLVTRLRSLILGGVAAYWLLMLILTHIPEIPQEIESGMGDKSEHRIGYCLLALGLGLSLSAWKGPLGLGRLAILGGVVAVYGALDETTQPLFGRDCDWFDWLADLQGGLIGGLMALAIDLAARYWRPGWFPPPETTSAT